MLYGRTSPSDIITLRNGMKVASNISGNGANGNISSQLETIPYTWYTFSSSDEIKIVPYQVLEAIIYKISVHLYQKVSFYTSPCVFSSLMMISATFTTVASTNFVHCAFLSGEFFSIPCVRIRQQVPPQVSLK